MAINTVRVIDDRVRIRTVLASVSDKSGIDELASGLLAAVPDVVILSTGGTHEALARALGPAAAGRLRQVSEYTGQPEMQGGLVKTLDWRIYLGLLAESHNAAHRDDLRRAGARLIDLVVVNLYPFQKTVARADAGPEAARGNIDVGGPCMIRAAAKNYHRVAVLTDPADYATILRELTESNGSLCLDTRFALAKKAFAITAAYDAAIAGWMAGLPYEAMVGAYDVLPTSEILSGRGEGGEQIEPGPAEAPRQGGR
jgi:phosphoribosylaminoimidazolecarboxamide formyltransferase/IMP cyclohydrolase